MEQKAEPLSNAYIEQVTHSPYKSLLTRLSRLYFERADGKEGEGRVKSV